MNNVFLTILLFFLCLTPTLKLNAVAVGDPPQGVTPPADGDPPPPDLGPPDDDDPDVPGDLTGNDPISGATKYNVKDITISSDRRCKVRKSDGSFDLYDWDKSPCNSLYGKRPTPSTSSQTNSSNQLQDSKN